ncbi:MAG TPA: L-lactate dehydrogenase [Bacteroidales bacterium]|nr:L-lactate dehydrogenase [Bacteroidales bacterium]
MREENPELRRKVVVVGAGSVGATYCYALAQSGLANEIIIYDRNEDLMRGQVLDLVHGQPFFPTVVIRSGSPKDYGDSQLVVIAAGSAQKPGETRLQLLKKNADITGTIAEEVAASGCKGVILVVSNPVDVLTYVALKRSGWDRSRVIGSGTVLDSSRFRYLLSQHCNVDVHNVHAYILGEHGDSEFAAWSMTHVAGMKIEDFCPFCGGCEYWEVQREQIEKQVRESAYHIINYKGSTQYAVGLALVRITGALLRNQHSVLTVSTMLNGEYGLNEVCLSVPCVVTDKGISRLIEYPLSETEHGLLTKSAAVLREAIVSLEASKTGISST